MSVLMEEMDRELAGTEVGKTFEREKVSLWGIEINTACVYMCVNATRQHVVWNIPIDWEYC